MEGREVGGVVEREGDRERGGGEGARKEKITISDYFFYYYKIYYFIE